MLSAPTFSSTLESKSVFFIPIEGQGSASSHTAKNVQNFYKTKCADFWPFFSLDPLDQAVLGILVEATYKTSHLDINTFKKE